MSYQQSAINRREFLAWCGKLGLVCVGGALLPLLPAGARELSLQKGYVQKKLSPYFTSLADKTVRCGLCPHHCEVAEGDRGLCEVRENIGGEYYSLVYGNPCAIHVDPIEKKPFFHVLPGTRSFSIATAGCNFGCKFCQNWEISQARPEETTNYALTPEAALIQAKAVGALSIASTYVEPVIFMEYMLDIGKLAQARPVLNVMHSNGFVAPAPLLDLCRVLDAACIDLKGFTEEYYREMCDGSLAPVLETLKTLRAQKVHTEIVTLLVPGRNDDMRQIRAMADWIVTELGVDVPLHFSRFYPQYKLKGLPPTPVGTLEKAREAALSAGLHYVYIGNVYGHPAENTYCPSCKQPVIRRAGYVSDSSGLSGGRCRKCGAGIPGIWSMGQVRPVV